MGLQGGLQGEGSILRHLGPCTMVRRVSGNVEVLGQRVSWSYCFSAVFTHHGKSTGVGSSRGGEGARLEISTGKEFERPWQGLREGEFLTFGRCVVDVRDVP